MRQMMMSRRWILLIVLSLLLNVSCTTQSSPSTTQSGPPGTSVPVVLPGELVVPDCDGAALCAGGFFLDDGVFYYLDCSAIKDSAVTDTVIGRGELYDEEVTANEIEGVPRTVMVAVSLPGGLCQDDSEALSEWRMAFPSTADITVVQETMCRVGELTEGQIAANRC